MLHLSFSWKFQSTKIVSLSSSLPARTPSLNTTTYRLLFANTALSPLPHLQTFYLPFSLSLTPTPAYLISLHFQIFFMLPASFSSPNSLRILHEVQSLPSILLGCSPRICSWPCSFLFINVVLTCSLFFCQLFSLC